MKKRTRILAALLALVMVLSMAACGGSDEPVETAGTQGESESGSGSQGGETTTPDGEKVVTIAMTSAWASWCP